MKFSFIPTVYYYWHWLFEVCVLCPFLIHLSKADGDFFSPLVLVFVFVLKVNATLCGGRWHHFYFFILVFKSCLLFSCLHSFFFFYYFFKGVHYNSRLLVNSSQLLLWSCKILFFCSHLCLLMHHSVQHFHWSSCLLMYLHSCCILPVPGH